MESRLFSTIISLLLIVCLPKGTVAQNLVAAARSGDIEALKVAVPADSNPSPELLVKPLFYASQSGHDDVVRYLLALGATPDAATDFGTALGIAARNNHTGTVSALLAAGADPNLAGGEDRVMPLHHAAERGAMESARLLLENGANVNSLSLRYDWPAIHFAALKDRHEMVDFLREMGAAPAPVEPLRPGELEAADAEEGRVLAFECGGCHGMEPGEMGSGQHPGPPLFGVIDRAKASVDGFPYSDAMRAQSGRWTPEELNIFLADVHNVVPGTSMSRGGQPDRAARVAIIAHIAQLAP